jgi:hypothetical protein
MVGHPSVSLYVCHLAARRWNDQLGTEADLQRHRDPCAVGPYLRWLVSIQAGLKERPEARVIDQRMQLALRSEHRGTVEPLVVGA